MTFFIDHNPKRQQAVWYEDVYKKVSKEADEVVNIAEIEELDLKPFSDSYEKEKEKIRVYRVNINRKRANESLQIMLFMLGD